MITAAMAMYHRQVRAFFTQTAEAIAHQTGFVRRTRLITGSLLLQALVWTVYKYGQMTMPTLAATAEELEPQCHVSAQAFQARFQTQAVALLQAMFAKALQYALLPSAAVVPLLSTFPGDGGLGRRRCGAVHLADGAAGSDGCLPLASRADERLCLH